MFLGDLESSLQSGAPAGPEPGALSLKPIFADFSDPGSTRRARRGAEKVRAQTRASPTEAARFRTTAA
jgi:hypothetical protein